MNSKERVAAAIARKPVDKVPLGFYAVDHDTVSKVLGRPTYVRNKIAQQIALWEGRRDELAESLKKDTVEFYRKIDCADLIIPREACLLPSKNYVPNPPQKIAEDKWEDKEGRIFQAVWPVNEIGRIHDPVAQTKEYRPEDFTVPVQVRPPDPSVFEAFDYLCEHLGQERYIASPTGGVTALTLLGGTEKGLALLALEPEIVLAANRRSAAEQTAR